MASRGQSRDNTIDCAKNPKDFGRMVKVGLLVRLCVWPRYLRFIKQISISIAGILCVLVQEKVGRRGEESCQACDGKEA
jgi:hypothetical protein